MIPMCTSIQVLLIFMTRLSFCVVPSDGTDRLDFIKRNSATLNGELKQSKRLIVLNIFIVVDYSVYRRWLVSEKFDGVKADESINFYYVHLISEVKEIYDAIKTSKYSYTVKLVGMYIAKSKQDSYFTEDALNAAHPGSGIQYAEVLQGLRKFVRTSGSVPKHTIVLAFTLHHAKRSQGLTPFGKACTSLAVSVMLDMGLTVSANVAAHEIGHSLGAKHDGDGNLCSASDLYLMTPKSVRSSRSRYRAFSECTIRYFEKTIYGMEKSKVQSCFSGDDKAFADKHFEKLVRKLPGERFTLNQQCQQSYGLNFTFCGNRGSLQNQNICSEMKCLSAGKCHSQSGLRAARGTPCGYRKWCMNEECVSIKQSPGILSGLQARRASRRDAP